MERQNSFSARFDRYVKKNNLLQHDEELLVGVSGGVDSIVLFHLLKRFEFKFSVAHCNFHLREGDCDEDDEFVRKLCKENDVPCFVKHFDTKSLAKERKKSIELTAREVRYKWFDELCSQKNIHTLVIAHHANDNLETAIYHMVKGTGISGLRGINAITLWNKKKIIRPLLFATKQEITDYAKKNFWTWREDYTNHETVYHRNLIRNIVIPELKKINPNIEKNFLRTSERISSVELFWKDYLDEIKKKYFHKEKKFLIIDIESIRWSPWFITAMWELLKEYNFSYNQLTCLLNQNDNVRVLKNNLFQLYDEGKRLIIVSKEEGDEEKKKVFDNEKINFEDVYIKKKIFDAECYEIKKHPNFAAFDVDKITFPIIIRRWEHGDFFYPLSKFQRFKKNVSDYLNDLKIPLHERKKQCVLVDAEGKILWLVGLRVDDRVKIDKATKKILEFKIVQN